MSGFYCLSKCDSCNIRAVADTPVPLCPCLENGLIAWPPKGVASFNELMMLEHFELQMKVIAQNKACW